MKALTVLLVEDNTDFASMVRAWLAASPEPEEFSLQWTDSLSLALARLDRGGIDIILLDLGLPDSEGLDTWMALRDKAAGHPTIILSSNEDETLALKTIELGAQDFVGKSNCTPELLIRSMRHTAVRHRALRQAGAPAPNASARVIAVSGVSGGAGTTTVAAVLADELHLQSGSATLLIDADLNPGLTAFMAGVEARYSVRDAFEWLGRMDESIWEGLITRLPGGLDMLAASGSMDISFEGPNAFNLRSVVEYACKHYTWIVLDLGRMNYFSNQIAGWADELILVTAHDIHALHQCRNAIATIDELGIGRERVQLVVNRREARFPVAPHEIQNMFGVGICASLPPSFEELHKACLEKRLPAPTDAFRVELRKVARTLAGLPDASPGQSSRPLRSLASRLFRRLKDQPEMYAT